MITGFCPESLSSLKLSVSYSGSVLSRCLLWRPHLYPVRPTATSGPFHFPYLCLHLWGQSLTPTLRSLSLSVSFWDPSSYRWVESASPSPRESKLRFSEVGKVTPAHTHIWKCVAWTAKSREFGSFSVLGTGARGEVSCWGRGVS